MRFLIPALILHMNGNKEPVGSRYTSHVQANAAFAQVLSLYSAFCGGWSVYSLNSSLSLCFLPASFKSSSAPKVLTRQPSSPALFLCVEGDALALEAKLSSRDADSPPQLGCASQQRQGTRLGYQGTSSLAFNTFRAPALREVTKLLT